MHSALFSPRARDDILAAIRWIAKDNPIAATGLRNAVVAAARRIGAHPLSGTSRPDIADDPVRFMVLTGYPYIMVYDANLDPPLILRVLHGARDLPRILRE